MKSVWPWALHAGNQFKNIFIGSERILDDVIWFGIHPLPETARGGRLRRALEQGDMKYWHVPWPEDPRVK